MASPSTQATRRSPGRRRGATPAVKAENAGSTVRPSRSQNAGQRRCRPGRAASGCTWPHSTCAPGAGRGSWRSRNGPSRCSPSASSTSSTEAAKARSWLPRSTRMRKPGWPARQARHAASQCARGAGPCSRSPRIHSTSAGYPASSASRRRRSSAVPPPGIARPARRNASPLPRCRSATSRARARGRYSACAKQPHRFAGQPRAPLSVHGGAPAVRRRGARGCASPRC